MHNIPQIPSYIQAPWEEEEWHCPECGGHQDDVSCHEYYCEQETWCFDCMNWLDDCECEGEE